jgi:hypothetical protein
VVQGIKTPIKEIIIRKITKEEQVEALVVAKLNNLTKISLEKSNLVEGHLTAKDHTVEEKIMEDLITKEEVEVVVIMVEVAEWEEDKDIEMNKI